MKATLKIRLIALLVLAIALPLWWFLARPNRGAAGEASTRFRWLGPNDKIVIDGSPANSISTVPIMGWTPPPDAPDR